ncbi:conserved protein of unknown function [Georgfuchsia toluolica]|uniref:SGNH hydrolase-type esterase domain-containing protein n=1 Tax=Georgfuchsia toluolica TaxID=424218 RepID=A0A916J318_9PROT|nr:GDSL-type esterase/lipase family protein [Georgfuchsia toluolica]CAG4882918.1 conserved protein of unknown function [Georgfuchsia toluolica]
MKRILSNLLLVVGASVLAALVAEAVVRLTLKDEATLFPRYQTDYQYGRYTLRGIRPHSEFWHTSPDGHWRYVTNNRGFRDTRDFAYGKPANTRRIMVLGDSHTQGYEVGQDATFSAVLERYLRHGNLPTEVINSGVSGFSTAEELVFLENEGVKYQPDVVVLGFYANDFEDNFKAGLFQLDGKGQLRDLKYEHIPGVRIQNFIYAIPGTQWLSENSYFYSLLFNTAWAAGKSALRRTAARSEANQSTQLSTQQTPEFEYAVATTESISPAQHALALALLERMQHFCANRGIRLIVVDIPRQAAPYRTRSSLPAGLIAELTAMGVEIVKSDDLLASVEGAAMLHVPHGHHHISEITHAMIGVELGRRIAFAPR